MSLKKAVRQFALRQLGRVLATQRAKILIIEATLAVPVPEHARPRLATRWRAKEADIDGIIQRGGDADHVVIVTGSEEQGNLDRFKIPLRDFIENWFEIPLNDATPPPDFTIPSPPNFETEEEELDAIESSLREEEAAE